jgi:hypothetical protein
MAQAAEELFNQLTVPEYIFPLKTRKRVYNVPCGDCFENARFLELVERTDEHLTVIFEGGIFSVSERDFISVNRLNKVAAAEIGRRPIQMRALHWRYLAVYLLYGVLQ